MAEIGGSNGGNGAEAPPLFGAAVMVGQSGRMEDAVSIKASLCSPPINRCLPVHYYGVFDGHGGIHFAKMCMEKLHAILKDEVMKVEEQIADESALQEMWRITMNRVFWRMELVAQNTCVCGTEGFRCLCTRNGAVFSGTTAVVVVLAEKHYVVANCGDSRAVLYRGGRIIPLSFDHKPSRAGEKARIEARGGNVVYSQIPRVQGILAVSRAIGDMYLKSLVISEPEVTFTRRDTEDEFVIMASDGIWDVIPTDMAGRVVRECLKGTLMTRRNYNQVLNSAAPPENWSISRCDSAALLLTHLAVARGSTDDISVVILDLNKDLHLAEMDYLLGH